MPKTKGDIRMKALVTQVTTKFFQKRVRLRCHDDVWRTGVVKAIVVPKGTTRVNLLISMRGETFRGNYKNAMLL